MVSAWPSAWIAAALLCAPAAMANVNTGNMPDLGYPEPNWYPIRQGSAAAPAVTYNETTTFWGDIEPYSTGNASLCKWVNTVENGGRGICQTDISWIHAAVGLAKSVFSDPVVNYILRFHLEGACYRSTQYSDNDAAQYCAPWWWDPATDTKVPTNETCYEITQQVIDQFTGQPVLRKWGCAHKAPFGGPVDSNDTVIAPPDDGSSNFTTVGVTASPPGTFTPVDTSLPPATPVAIPSAAPVAPVDPNATVPVANATVPVANATVPVANATAPVTPVAPVANATAPVAPVATTPVVADANATAPVAPVAPVSNVTEPAVATLAPADNYTTTATVAAPETAPRNLSATTTAAAPTTEAPATIPALAPEAPAASPVAAGGRRLQQNNLALPDVNGTAGGNGTATPAAPAANTTTPAPAANTTTPAAPAVNATAPAITTAPATVPTAAPVAPAAPAVPVGFPTAAEDATVQTTAAVSQGRVIATQQDFVKLFEVYNSDGLEGWPTRQQWYACQDFTAPFSVGRETCYREAFGKNFGLNAVVLRSMLQVMRFDIVNCYGNFATNGAQQGQKSSKEWCEVDTANWIISNTLPQNNITGTPAQPMSLDPTVTAPPPPPPPPPPFPPPPMVEPIQLVAVDDPFAPVNPAPGGGGSGISAPQTTPETAPGDRGVVVEDSAAYGVTAAASVILGAVAAIAVLL